jgi:myosin V
MFLFIHELLILSHSCSLRTETDNFSTSEEKKDNDKILEGETIPHNNREYDRLDCEPHIYEVSSLAFQGLIANQTNQTILVSGESGSGKTESVKIVLKHLASLRPGPNPFIRTNDDDLISHVLSSSPIFEAFGNAKTAFNANSSRFGKVTKLHFAMSSHSGCLVGSSFDTYMLESNRVASHVTGERNFHIFYQMLSAPSNVKNELLGPDWRETTPTDFRYLNRFDCGIMDDMLDASNWTYTLKALIMFGWDGCSLERLMRALGIILLIGNIEFQEETENKASIKQPADLFLLSTSIGIPVEELELALTQRTIQTAQDLLLVPFTPSQANEACEALAKAIYSGIFALIVRQINLLTSAPPAINGKTKSIALVDIFGFESFDSNRFEQFCINYANERLQLKYIVDNLTRHMLEYETEGIIVPHWKDIENSSTVDLFEGVPGLIRSLNEQCIRPNGSSEVRYLERFSFFVCCPLNLTFRYIDTRFLSLS